jgi:molybdate transport system ATP-binding protein
VALFRDRPSGSPRNVWRGTVGDVEPALDRMRVQIAGPIPLVAEVTPSAAAELGLHERGQVWVAVKATEIRVSRA